MAIELKQELRLSQQLVMTPQLQQAIKLLQLSRLELVGLVQQELQENPVLEEVLDGEESEEAAGEELGSRTFEAAAEPAPAPASSDGGEETREPTDAEKVADIEWQDYMDANPQTGIRGSGGDDDRASIESTLTRRPTLAEHLEWQIQLADLPVEHPLL